MGYDVTQSSRPPAEPVLDEPVVCAQGSLETECSNYVIAIEQLAIAYVLTNPRGAIVHANAAASAMLGCRSLADKLLIAFVARRDTHTFREALGELATRRREEVAFQMRMRKRGGPVFLAQLLARVIEFVPGRTALLRWTIEGS